MLNISTFLNLFNEIDAFLSDYSNIKKLNLLLKIKF
jgi:hypothetical protein